ncbi:GalNAc-alpha-(1-_4)-GalNAc-alpha-(1-_3)-diNAcBac-PP-undecaprenol alpha-1,4-N-acetyl-D-galactosaminyltransferase [Burkholderia multivorans]
MKVMIVVHSLLGGGAERVAANLAHDWAERGWDVSLVTLLSQASDFYTVGSQVRRIALNLADGSNSIIDNALTANVRRIVRLRRVIRTDAPHVVLGIDTPGSVLSILASRGLPCKVIATEHSHPPQIGGRRWKILRRWLYSSADQVVALTRETGAWLEQHCRCKRVKVIPNAVSLPIPVIEPVLETGPIVAADRRMLLAVGRLVETKGFDRLIDAFAQIAADVPQWDLVILGDGREHDALQSRLASAGLTGRVLLPGRAGNVADWYARADLYVMSSRFEGFPMTLTEAMASGCPAVSYDCDTGPRDIIEHGDNGLLVRPVGDTQKLAEALHTLMTNDRERARMAARAPRVLESFSPARTFAKWREVFAEAGVRVPPDARNEWAT